MSLPFPLVWCLLFLLSLDWRYRTGMAHKQQGGVLHTHGVIVPVQSVKQLDRNANVIVDPLLVPPCKSPQSPMDASLNQRDITK